MARALKPRAPAHALLDPALGPTDPPLREPVPVTASAHERGVRLAGLLGR
jgi:hypothetical protein